MRRRSTSSSCQSPGGGLISGMAVALKALVPGAQVVRGRARGGRRCAALPSPGQDRRQRPRSSETLTTADGLRVNQLGDLTFAHIPRGLGRRHRDSLRGGDSRRDGCDRPSCTARRRAERRSCDRSLAASSRGPRRIDRSRRGCQWRKRRACIARRSTRSPLIRAPRRNAHLASLDQAAPTGKDVFEIGAAIGEARGRRGDRWVAQPCCRAAGSLGRRVGWLRPGCHAAGRARGQRESR